MFEPFPLGLGGGRRSDRHGVIERHTTLALPRPFSRVHLAHLCGVRGVDCEPGQQAHCDKRNSNHIAQFRHLPSPLGFQGRLIRRAPLTSGDPFMSRKTVEKWVKSLRDTRERLISPHARGPIGIEARNRLVAGPSIDGSARRVSSPEQR